MAFPNGDLITIMKLIERSLPLKAREKKARERTISPGTLRSQKKEGRKQTGKPVTTPFSNFRYSVENLADPAP